MHQINHIEVHYLFIMENILLGDIITTSFINSNDQFANVFTTSLRNPQIGYIWNKLGARDFYDPTWGAVFDIVDILNCGN